MKLIKAMATVAGMTLLSRVFGFVRDMLTAIVMGAGPLADAFFVALKLPNFFRRISAEGAFSVSFVPLFSEALEKEGQDKAVNMARNMMGVMCAILIVFVALCIMIMPWIIAALAPGFDVGGMRYEAAVTMSRVTFPYLLMISLSALVGGVMNSIGRYGAYAFLPALFNMCLITALLTHDVLWDSPAYALAWGVLVSGFVQFGWIIWLAARAGVLMYPTLPQLTPKVKKLFKLMLPGLLGAGVMHVNLFADMVIASFLPSGSISYLYYADRLNQLPLGVVGIAIGTALLPMLSRALAANKMDEAENLFNRALEACLLLALPASIALLIAAKPFIQGLFHYGAFTLIDAQQTALVLQCYAVGLPAYIAARVFQSACFARQDTATPVKISVICTGVNIALSLTFINYIGVAGIALATGIAGWVQIGLLGYVMKRQNRLHFDHRLRLNAIKIAIACVVMSGVIVLYLNVLGDIFDVASAQRITALIGLVVIGKLVYAGSAFALKIIRPSELKLLFKTKQTVKD